MSQTQSPLFRLPRELRDEIYRYSILEVDGYIHDPASGRLRTARGTPIDIALVYVCKQVAAETYAMALKENTIKFTSSMDLSSTADILHAKNFRRVWEQSEIAFDVMLKWAAACVTTEDLETLQSMYPHHDGIRSLCSLSLPDAVKQLQARNGIWNRFRRELKTVTRLAARDLVILISSHHDFHRSTAKEYDVTLRAGQMHPHWNEISARIIGYGPEDVRRYAPESQQRIIQSNVRPWDILSRAEVDELFQLLRCPVFDADSDTDSDSESEGPTIKRSYFSGTAWAIQFLKRLQPETRKCIRNIVIEENHSSVADPWSHAHGLIPYCKENPNLRVEILIDVWNAILWRSYILVFPDSHYLSTHLALTYVAEWLREASFLPISGVLPGQCTFTFHMEEPQLLQKFWEGIKKAAEMQEAADHLREVYSDQRRHPHFYVAEDLPSIVKQVLEGNLPVRFDVDLGEIWDREQAIFDLEHTIPSYLGLEDMVDFTDLEQRNDKWEAMRKKYIVGDR